MEELFKQWFSNVGLGIVHQTLKEFGHSDDSIALLLQSFLEKIEKIMSRVFESVHQLGANSIVMDAKAAIEESFQKGVASVLEEQKKTAAVVSPQVDVSAPIAPAPQLSTADLESRFPILAAGHECWNCAHKVTDDVMLLEDDIKKLCQNCGQALKAIFS